MECFCTLAANGIAVAHDLAVQRVACADLLRDGVFASRTYLAKVSVTLTDDGFPDQKLRGRPHEPACRALVLRTPRGRDRPRIAVLKDTADKQLNIVG